MSKMYIDDLSFRYIYVYLCVYMSKMYIDDLSFRYIYVYLCVYKSHWTYRLKSSQNLFLSIFLTTINEIIFLISFSKYLLQKCIYGYYFTLCHMTYIFFPFIPLFWFYFI